MSKKCNCRCLISYIALILVVIGAINWGLWGFFQFDFVSWLCGGDKNTAARVIYSIIGLSGLWSIRLLCCHCKHKPERR